jgi:hypothetical protein
VQHHDLVRYLQEFLQVRGQYEDRAARPRELHDPAAQPGRRRDVHAPARLVGDEDPGVPVEFARGDQPLDVAAAELADGLGEPVVDDLRVVERVGRPAKGVAAAKRAEPAAGQHVLQTVRRRDAPECAAVGGDHPKPAPPAPRDAQCGDVLAEELHRTETGAAGQAGDVRDEFVLPVSGRARHPEHLSLPQFERLGTRHRL